MSSVDIHKILLRVVPLFIPRVNAMSLLWSNYFWILGWDVNNRHWNIYYISLSDLVDVLLLALWYSFWTWQNIIDNIFKGYLFFVTTTPFQLFIWFKWYICRKVITLKIQIRKWGGSPDRWISHIWWHNYILTLLPIHLRCYEYERRAILEKFLQMA